MFDIRPAPEAGPVAVFLTIRALGVPEAARCLNLLHQ